VRAALYEPEHDAFRQAVRSFVAKQVAPFHEQWEKDGVVDRGVWLEGGKQGLLGMDVPEQYGGGGSRTSATTASSTRSSPGGRQRCRLHAPQRRHGALPARAHHRRAEGPLAAAVRHRRDDHRDRDERAGRRLGPAGPEDHRPRDGSDWVLSGSKTFITNGILSDLVLVVARTDPEAGAHGFSLLAVERGMKGFERGRNLDKVGMKAQDTAELFFDEVRVPAANLVGEEGKGFIHLMNALPQERLSIAVVAVAAARHVLDLTVEYCKGRTAFGRPIGSFQHNRFVLAEMETEVSVAEVFLEKCVLEHNAGRLDVKDAAMAKWWTTELQKRVVDQCVQLHGGYGYMLEYPVAKAFIDSRVQTIYGGTTEVMKEIIGRSLGV
jgi:alkylation response protein AidB-like acyl-CoA dehydrogenase